MAPTVRRSGGWPAGKRRLGRLFPVFIPLYRHKPIPIAALGPALFVAAPSVAVGTTGRLVATIRPTCAILAHGTRPKSLRPGTYIITVRDVSASRYFRL